MRGRELRPEATAGARDDAGSLRAATVEAASARGEPVTAEPATAIVRARDDLKEPRASSRVVDPLNVIGHALDGKYQVDTLLGSGGMGAVYLATHLGTGRTVALKVIAPEFMAQAEFVERFRREARAAGRLRHPNVVNVTDFGFATLRERQVAYLVMEHLAGRTLGDLLREQTQGGGALPLMQVVDIVEQICLALTHAHQRGVIHRDLKPDNILLETDGRGGVNVKVLDFGLAKLKQGERADEPARGSSPTGARRVDALAHTATALPSASGDAPLDSGLGHAPTQISAPTPAAERATAPSPAPAPVDDELLARHAAPRAQAAIVRTPTLPAPASTPTPPAPSDAPALATSHESSHESSLEFSHELSPVPPSLVTAAGATMGTPAYMSPEQCSLGPIDERADLYALGVMTYEMLAGRRPFTGSVAELIEGHTRRPPPPLPRRPDGATRQVARFVAKTLAKDPADRPASAASFAAALRASAEGVWRLLQRALLLYTEHFVRLTTIGAAILLAPPLLAKLLTLPLELRLARAEENPAIALTLSVHIFHVQLQYLALGLFSPVVAQTLQSPMAHPRIRPLLGVLRARARPLLRAVLRLIRIPLPITLIGAAIIARAVNLIETHGAPEEEFGLLFALGLPLFLFGLVWMLYILARYWVTMPIVFMEGVTGKDAVDRARALTRGGFWVLVWVLLVRWALNLLAYGDTARGNIDTDSTAGNLIVSMILGLPVEVTLAIIMALVYFKFRQARGETMSQILAGYRATSRGREDAAAG
ncbi:MAG: serine/threonine protein kinase [Myxococcales bacterium]|nr:serine/threonine protein kinase [Myxococcales bacterium]